MILLKLKMVDFRQYYGEAEIEFAVPNSSETAPRNVTLVHGENGVGKTTLMNAITWCLYGHLGDDFEGKKELVNELSYNEGKRSCRVETTFRIVDGDSDDYFEYTAIRHWDQENKDDKKFKLFAIDKSGNHQEVNSAKSFIQSIVPREMCRYFFFHGEGLINIQSSKPGSAGSEAFRNAVRAILGCTFVEQAIEDLSSIHNKLSREIAAISSKNQKYARLELQLDTSLKEKDKLSVERDEWKVKLDKTEEEMREIDGKLAHSNIDLAREIQKGLDRLRKDLDTSKNRRRASCENQVALIERFGWKVFGSRLARAAEEIMKDAAHKGKIPAPYDRPFVQSILDKEECVCGRPVSPNSAEHRAILSLLETANDGSVMKKRISAGSVADSMALNAADFPKLVLDIEEEIRGLEQSIKDTAKEIGDYEDKLQAIDDKEIAALQAKRKEAQERVKTCEGGRSVCAHRLAEVDRTIVDIKRQLQGALPNTPQAAILSHMANQTEYLEKRCVDILSEIEENSRLVIASEVNDILKKYSTQDYRIAIDSSFGFRLIRSDGSVVKKSKGETLLLNLSFVSALIQHAKKRSKANGDILIPGTIAPFVIDAPFGELDKAYRSATARFLPSSSEQLILLLSSSHWTEDVDTEIRQRIGAEYILVSHKDYKRDDKPPVAPLTINEKIYEQARYGAPKRMTTIERVN